MTAHLDELAIRTGRGDVLALPTIALYLFSDADLDPVASSAADLIEQYFAGVGIDKITTRFDSDGNDRPLTARKLAKDLKVLRTPQPQRDTIRLLYDSDSDSWIGPYGISFYSREQDPALKDPDDAHLLHFSFPLEYGQEGHVERLVRLIEEMASAFPISVGFAGYSFRRIEGTVNASTRAVNASSKRFLGFDPGYLYIYDDMRGATFGAHWIDIVGPDLCRRLGLDAVATGGGDAVAKQLPNNALMIRNSKYPPVGDVNRFARDVGAMPATARLLRPVRAKISALGEPEEAFDAQAWLARFDERETEEWDNTP